MPPSRAQGAWIAAALILAACAVDAIDLAGKNCPCASGWVCIKGHCELGTGGASTGGASTGGASTGGASTGGASTGGASTGGTSTGGTSTGGTSTGGAGGTSVRCGAETCDLPDQFCCHASSASSDTGACSATGTSCTGTRMLCDDAADCGGVPKVCCAQLDSGGQFKADVQCKAAVSDCKTSGNGIVELLCDPAANTPCPTGLSCKNSTKIAGHSSCRP